MRMRMGMGMMRQKCCLALWACQLARADEGWAPKMNLLQLLQQKQWTRRTKTTTTTRTPKRWHHRARMASVFRGRTPRAWAWPRSPLLRPLVPWTPPDFHSPPNKQALPFLWLSSWFPRAESPRPMELPTAAAPPPPHHRPDRPEQSTP